MECNVCTFYRLLDAANIGMIQNYLRSVEELRNIRHRCFSVKHKKTVWEEFLKMSRLSFCSRRLGSPGSAKRVAWFDGAHAIFAVTFGRSLINQSEVFCVFGFKVEQFFKALRISACVFEQIWLMALMIRKIALKLAQLLLYLPWLNMIITYKLYFPQ